MVWFQCEDCGDNLKKPKLPGHFRVCSAFKLSCIDCGEVFNQQSVESHTQCISEAEKYGPKGQAKTPIGRNSNPNSDTKKRPDVDVNVGLSDRPPWFCSLCKTKASSKQTLLLHADGKKHRAKARAFHAANQQQSGKTEPSNPKEVPERKSSEEPNALKPSEPDNTELHSNKKRKLESSQNSAVKQRVGEEKLTKLGNGEAVHLEKQNVGETNIRDKRSENIAGGESSSAADKVKKIKWKKMITSALKSNPDDGLKFKKLKKAVLKSLRESGYTNDEIKVQDILEKKITKSARFAVEGKFVRLVAKS